jgi:hypothetical protein
MFDTTRSRTLAGFVAGFGVCLAAVFSFQAWQASAFPGELDTTFRPMNPCRLIDTRPASQIGSETTLGADDTRTLAVHGSHGQCTLPPDAVGLSLNVTPVGASAPTYLTIWPGGTRPNASSLNPAPGTAPIPNAVVTPITPAGTFKLYNRAGSVDVIIDVNGYHMNWTLRDLDLRLGELEATDFLKEHERTTAAYDRGNSSVALTSTPVSVASVTVEHSTSGRVILNSSANVFGDLSVGYAECSITTSSSAIDPNHRQAAETLTFGDATIARTRGYTINKGAFFPPPDEREYHLVCREVSGDSYIRDANLTAVFVPDPKVFKKFGPGLP